jgi:glycosyltransferase involved in cell wall biosynthesis
LVKKILGKEAKNTTYSDIAPWISILIQEFEKFEDVELHVISPQVGLKGFVSEFEIKGVFYHFYNPDISLFLSSLIKNVRLWLKLQPGSFFAKRFIKKIKPDVLNLIGAENFYHSCVVLDIENIPILTTCQTIYTNPQRLLYDPNADKSKNWATELLIQQKLKYFGCGGRMHRDLLLENNPEATIFRAYLPAKMPSETEEQINRYDFVCFAAVHGGNKGTEDAIKALAIVKNNKSDVTLNIVGRCSAEVKASLDKLIAELELADNVVFHGYFPLHEDMFRQLKKSKFAVLPIRMDIISSTVREAMFLEIPVVTYKTSGTPLLNKDKDCVLLADIGDIAKMASQMSSLLQSESLADKLRTNSVEYIKIHFNTPYEARNLVDAYRAVIKHYNNNEAIPNKLLFNIEDFPIY